MRLTGVLTPVRMVVPVRTVVRASLTVVRGRVRSMVALTVVLVELVVRVWRMVVRGPVRSMAELTAALVADGSPEVGDSRTEGRATVGQSLGTPTLCGR
ncbi:MAG TPA: hypothetical protein VGD71_17520 [Kribbella sp.]